MRCDQCRWWKAIFHFQQLESVDGGEFRVVLDGGSNSGQCRRFPPPASTGLAEFRDDRWPTTNKGDWCGEFAAIGEL